MTKTSTQTKVFVGLSGGVDSSVAAALLKQQGYDVTGVFIRIWREEWGECGWKEDRRDAMAVALALDIPFLTIDLSQEYYDGVAKYMISEYQAGRTPNPDVMCNTVVKFGAFLDWAKAQGADYIATGHYVRRREISNSKHQIQNANTQTVAHEVRMLQGVDENKDQTYFLWQLTQEQLQHALFPVGELHKPRVRELAREFGLPTAEKKDSQGLCFIGKVAMKEFLQTYITPKRGEVLNEAGEVIGHHDGAVFLTLGQRHGFTITHKTPQDAPYYVVAKDVQRNTVTVAHKTGAAVMPPEPSATLQIANVNWIAHTPQRGARYQARFRYRQPLQECTIALDGEGGVVTFAQPQEIAAPGQSVVVYDGDECIGGGVICPDINKPA